MGEVTSEITRLLREWSAGDKSALKRLMPLVCGELRELAGRYVRGEVERHTLRPTALVNELYLKLHGFRSVDWENSAHFFGTSADMMRRILVDAARTRLREKRGGGAPHVPFEEIEDIALPQPSYEQIIAVDDALEKLAEMDERQAKIVELRFFTGLTVAETAAVLGISTPTVKREWKSAKLWLHREVTGL